MKYICPMHPEITDQKPGDCPKCGMSLEKETISLDVQGKYICPMHPEIEQVGPGSCPICGMALEPKNAAEDEEDTSEL
ncbi:MAG: hypothetical protein E2O70_08675, partial [Candidatus Dadabacteria bacterium]